MTIPSFPVPIDTTPEDDSLYLGISRQDLKSHQAICELIDNSISAKPTGHILIEIHIEKNGEDINIKVADTGIGVSLNDITEKILRIGGRGSHKGKLNEHGFGLKNSLCVLTGNKRLFSIVTVDTEASTNNLIYRVNGPFRRDMNVELGDEKDWSENILMCNFKTGTRIIANTTLHYFKTLYPSAYRLDTLIERLIEHLGVLYRSYLIDQRNEIWIRWRDVTEGATGWNDEKVIAIQIPFKRAEEEYFSIEYNGKEYKAHYKWGELDDSVIQDGSKGKPYPLKIYYQKNTRSQGVDINIRGRVILPHTLEYLWPDLNRHNDFNPFIGELKIDAPEFSTVNNKTQLDPNNPIWEKLWETLQHDKYKPPRIGSASYTERELQKKFKEKLPAIVSGSSVQEDFPTWPGLGVKIDLLHHFADDKEEIYELKSGTARPIDVYQLVMYWDGRVKDGVRPRLGRLVCKEANDHILNLINYWNSRKDAGGSNYNLEFRKIDELV